MCTAVAVSTTDTVLLLVRGTDSLLRICVSFTEHATNDHHEHLFCLVVAVYEKGVIEQREAWKSVFGGRRVFLDLQVVLFVVGVSGTHSGDRPDIRFGRGGGFLRDPAAVTGMIIP